MDPHKWLFAPFDCAALLYREPVAGQGRAHPGRLLPRRHPHRRRGREWNPTDYAYHLTRRARGLPLWFSLAVHGIDAYREAIEAAIELARQAAAEIIDRRRDLELIREPELSVVLFRRRRLGRRATTTRGPTGCCTTRSASSPPSEWEGETVARFAFLHPHTTMDLVREILDRMG